MTNTTAVPDLPALPNHPHPGCVWLPPERQALTAYGQACIAHYIATQPAPSGDAVEVLREIERMLETYATSYEAMACQNKEKPYVHMISVATDIRQNMKSVVLKHIATSRAATVAKDGGDTVVRVCPERDIECGRNERAWCNTCPKRATPKPEASATLKSMIDQLFEARAALPPPIVEPVTAVECGRLALNVRHKDAHKAADAFWTYWRENGETHKRGYYESTWGAINRAIRMVGVVEHDYWPEPKTYPKNGN